MKTCGHVSSRDKIKKQVGSYFVKRAGPEKQSILFAWPKRQSQENWYLVV